jgi:hypothetical protein
MRVGFKVYTAVVLKSIFNKMQFIYIRNKTQHTIIIGKRALFKPQPSLEDSAIFAIQFSLLWILQQ